MRLHWTPEQVGRLDPDFVDELMARLEAQSIVDEQMRKDKERKARLDRARARG